MRALLESVGPMILRHSAMASCLLNTRAQTGPLLMKSTRRSKKGFP